MNSVISTLGSFRTKHLGVIRLEHWPEGYVLWVGGEIRWRSFDWPRDHKGNKQ